MRFHSLTLAATAEMKSVEGIGLEVVRSNAPGLALGILLPSPRSRDLGIKKAADPVKVRGWRITRLETVGSGLELFFHFQQFFRLALALPDRPADRRAQTSATEQADPAGGGCR